MTVQASPVCQRDPWYKNAKKLLPWTEDSVRSAVNLAHLCPIPHTQLSVSHSMTLNMHYVPDESTGFVFNIKYLLCRSFGHVLLTDCLQKL